jgi:3-hydroxyisobutyrate dehydrogenase
MQKVAFLGLGIMGSGMANNLFKAGFPLTVWNRTRARADALAKQGVPVADTPRQAVADADVVFSMVGDDNASREVWLGDNGALGSAKLGAVLIESSTLSPEWIRELADIAQKRGHQLLDAPVTGSKSAAAEGSLRMLVGGDAAALEQARPVLEKISTQIMHLGPTGAGATLKLINNMMGAVHIAAVSEGIALAERAGLDMQQVASLILNGPSGSPIVKLKLDRMMSRNYDNADFSLRWMQKDAGYAMELAKDFNLPLKTVTAAHEVLQMARDKGLDDADFAATVEGLRSLDNEELKGFSGKAANSKSI